MLKACLNGGRRRTDHPAVPLSAGELAADAVACRAVGAGAVHIHVRDADGRETLDAVALAAAVLAIREAAPGLPVGVSTGAWIVPDPRERLAAIRAWTVRPDFASVNVHEEGADRVAELLHQHGVGVEAGVWTTEAVEAYAGWRVPCLRMLVEIVRAPDAGAAVTRAGAILDRLRSIGGSPAVLLHGEGAATWPVLREAVRLGVQTRIGLEDTTTGPDGAPVTGNADLVAAAVALGAR